MYRPFLSQILIFTLLIVFSCNKNPVSVPVISLNELNEEFEIYLTDIISDIRIVPLEFVKAHPLTNRSRINVGKKYILCTARDALLQYNSEGRFLRILAVRGKGPGEIERFSYPVVDKDERYVYLRNDYSDGKIERINLESGEFEKPIPVAFSSAVETFAYVDNDKFLIIPSNWAPTEYYYFIQDIEGNFISGHEMKRDGLIQLNFRYIRPQQLREDYLYSHSKFTGDTVFRINQKSMKPYFVFGGKGNTNDIGKPGYNPFVRGCTNEYIFLENWLSEENGGAIKENYFYLMDPDLEVFNIGTVKNDIIGSEYRGEDLRDLYWDKIIAEGDIITIEISAMEFLSSASGNPDEIPMDFRQRIFAIADTLTENDNQVLLIGKPKRLEIKK